MDDLVQIMQKKQPIRVQNSWELLEKISGWDKCLKKKQDKKKICKFYANVDYTKDYAKITFSITCYSTYYSKI